MLPKLSLVILRLLTHAVSFVGCLAGPIGFGLSLLLLRQSRGACRLSGVRTDTVLCDAEMVASGITRRRLPKDNEVLFIGKGAYDVDPDTVTIGVDTVSRS